MTEHPGRSKAESVRLLERGTIWALEDDVNDYHINIFFSEEDEGYIADIPDLEACCGFGETAESALAAVEEAREVWLEAARRAGKPIPAPRDRPGLELPDMEGSA